MARSFNGTTDLVFNASATITLALPYTIAAWFNASSLPGAYGTLLRHNNAAPGMFTRSSGKIAYAGGATLIDGSFILTTGVWTHALLADTGSTAQGYINGVTDGASFASGGSSPQANLRIGNDLGNTNSYPGSLADVAAWNVTLSALEVSALAKGARPSTVRPKSLVYWCPFDGLQSPEPDLSGNVLNGTLTGTNPAFGPPFAPFTPRWPQFWFPPPPLPSFVLMPQIVM